MPGGKTHLAIGVGTALAIGSALPLDSSLPLMLGATVVVCGIGALAPDLDIDNNELEEMARHQGRDMSRWMRNTARDSDGLDKIAAAGVGTVVAVTGEGVSRGMEGLAWMIQRVTTHRGLTHSLLALLFTSSLAMYLSTIWSSHGAWWGLCWGAGYASHLISDSWTWSGVRWLQPFSDRRFWLVPRFLRFRVGTWRDTALRYISPFVGLAIWIWQSRVLDYVRR